MINLSITFKVGKSDFFHCQVIHLATARDFLLVRGATLDKRHHPIASCNVPR